MYGVRVTIQGCVYVWSTELENSPLTIQIPLRCVEYDGLTADKRMRDRRYIVVYAPDGATNAKRKDT